MMMDPVHDKGSTHFYRLHKLIGFPEFVKQANFPDEDECKDLPDTSFADVIGRHFPVHTKAACLLSYAYFKAQQPALEKNSSSRISAQFNKMIRFWGIEKDAEHVARCVDVKPIEKHAANVEYALTINHNGKEFKFYPIHNAGSIVKSAEALVHDRSKLTFDMRKKAADAIMSKASQCHVSLTQFPSAFHSMLCNGSTMTSLLAAQINRRVLLTKDAQAIESLNKLKDGLVKSGEAYVTQEKAQNVVRALDVFDRFAGLTEMYGESLPYPEEVAFEFNKQSVDKLRNDIVELTNGSSYWTSDLVKAANAFEVLGDLKDELLNNLSGEINTVKMAEILPTLPRDDADRLDIALSAAGVPKAKLDKEAMIKAALFGRATPDPKYQALVKKANKVLRTINERQQRADAYREKKASEVLDALRKPKNHRGQFMNKAPNKGQAESIDAMLDENKDKK